MKAYRAHVGILQPGQSVPISQNFFEGLTPAKKAVEELLESVRPRDLQKRESAIYLFEDEHQVRRWASVQRPERRLYQVEVGQGELKVDWCWLQKIENDMAQGSLQAKDMAQKYWAGQPTAAPCWEFLATSATVVDEIDILVKERNRFIAQKFGQPDNCA